MTMRKKLEIKGRKNRKIREGERIFDFALLRIIGIVLEQGDIPKTYFGEPKIAHFWEVFRKTLKN